MAVVAAVVGGLLVTHFSAGPATAGKDRTTSPTRSGSTSPVPSRPISSAESKPVYSYKKAVRQTVWVDTGLDSDRDGKTDRVAVDIVRPSEPAAKGRKVPVIMEASPYYSSSGRGNENQLKTYDAKGDPVRFPLFYDNFFVPRGYAFVAVDLPGTGRSDGCTDAGGPVDVQSAKAVVDWLNGRAHGYTTRSGTAREEASWTNGATAMIGKSWDGSIANGVAATGVAGLKTIVAISSISSWYDAYFSQGAPLQGIGTASALIRTVQSEAVGMHCAAVNKALGSAAARSGDWSSIWAERNYVADAAKVKASVFVVHGQQDANVRPIQFGQWWDALGKAGVQRKIWLSQTGHVDPFDYRRADWVDTLHRWFDHALLGYPNGIDSEPMADIERTPGHWTTDAVWPPKSAAPVTLGPGTGTQAGVGTLGTHAGTGTETFTTDPNDDEEGQAAKAGTPTPDKSGFLTRPLTHDLRLSGSPQVTVTVTSTTATAELTAILVDLGPATIRNYHDAGLGISTLTGRDCWGESTPGDSACYKKTAADTTHVDATVFSRGAADLRNHASLLTSPPLTPGKPSTMAINLGTTDHVVPAGHRLALIVAGADGDLILSGGSRPTLTLDLAGTSLRIPAVGGTGAVLTAGATG